MNWIDLTHVHQLTEIKALSQTRAQVIFKHSTRCATSSMALNRLERTIPPDQTDFYFLDLIRHRDISDMIATEFAVYHESPQVLIIKNMECVYDESHGGIQMDEITEQIQMA